MILYATLQWAFNAAVKIVGLVLGFPMVALALFFVRVPVKPYAWRLIRLPVVFAPWDNPRDGCLGDNRLDYWTNGEQYPQWFDKLPLRQYVKAYYWLAIRNPVNNLSRYWLGCKVDDCHVRLLAGQEFVSDTKKSYGYQFVMADGQHMDYYGFYLYKPITENKFLMIRFGYKVEPRYNDDVFEGKRKNKAYKGTTFRIAIRGKR